MPQAGCRIRTSASAPSGASERVLIFCWYHNSSQPAFKASATSTAGLGAGSAGSSSATLARRLAAPNGVCSEGSIAIPYSSPICLTALTMIESG